MSVSGNTIRMQMNDYRGLSAYEIAVQNGFEGTEKQWLESLKGEKGADGDMVTVNHKRSVDGNISVNGTDIYMYPGMQDETVAQAIEGRVKTADVVDDPSTAGESGVLSAAAGKAIQAAAAKKAEMYAQKVSLPVASWEQEGEIYGQSVAVEHITIDHNKTSAIVSPPTDRDMEEAYLDCQVRAAAQGDGVIAFTCTDLPEIDLEANVMVVVQGVTAE